MTLPRKSASDLVDVPFTPESVEVFRSLLREMAALPGTTISFDPDGLEPSMVVYTMVGVAETFLRRRLEGSSQPAEARP